MWINVIHQNQETKDATVENISNIDECFCRRAIFDPSLKVCSFTNK